MRFIFLLLIFPHAALAAQIVLFSTPSSRVISDAKKTHRELLEHSRARQEYQILITKKEGRYLWASRNNDELHHTRSGHYHIFVSLNGAGYIEVFDNHTLPIPLRPKGARYSYKVHKRSSLGNITFWGTTDEFEL